MISLILLASLAALSLSASLPVCPIALMVPMTGPYSDQGPIVQQAVNMAINDVTTCTFTVKVYDSKCAKANAIAAMKLAIQVNVSAVIGDLCSGGSLGALPFANAAKMPMVSPSATSPQLSIPNDYFFRTCPNDNFQGAYLAAYLAKYYTRAAVIYGANEPYGEGIAHTLSSNLNLNPNITLVGALGFLSKDSQGAPLPWVNGTLAGILNGRPQVIVFTTNNPLAVIGASAELRELGFKGDFAGSDAITSNPAFEDYPLLEGMFGSSLYTGTAAFKNKWAATYGGTVQDVPEIAAQAYDALRVIAKVCVVNGQLKARKDIFASLNRRGFSVTPAATGTVIFDANGDNIVSQYNVLEMKNGTWKIRV